MPVRLVIARQPAGADLMEVPKGPVIRSHIDHVSDHVLRGETPPSPPAGAGALPGSPCSISAPIHGGRLLIASICSFSIKIVSLRIQLLLRTVRSRSSELPTRLKSGCVLVSKGVFVKCLQLHFEHRNPGTLRCLVVGKRIVAEWPCMSFTPESIHERVDEFDVGIAIELRCQQAHQLPKRLLKEWIVEARLIGGYGFWRNRAASA